MQFKKKLYASVKIISLFAAGFTIVHGLLFPFLILNRLYFDKTIYHYSTNFYWVGIFIVIPIIGGICFYLLLRKQRAPGLIRIFFLFIVLAQIAFTIFATDENYKYWGYTYKRPPVFKEISNAEQLLTFCNISNADTIGLKPLYIFSGDYQYSDTLYGRDDPYYGKSDRALMVLEDKEGGHKRNLDFRSIYNDSAYKINANVLSNLEKQMFKTYSIMHLKNSYGDKQSINGDLLEFSTIDNTKYIFVAVEGGEISNDHFPFYEFLFAEKNGNYQLVKKQMFFTDAAGIEGLEYANMAPLFSLILVFVGILFCGFTIIGINVIKLLKM